MSNPSANTFVDPGSLTADQVILKDLLSKIAGVFDNKERDINGADAVAFMSELYDTIATVTLPAAKSVIQAHVIYSASEEGFWSNEDGWGHIDSASHYFDPPGRLPMSSGDDTQLVTLARGHEIEKELSGSDNPAPTA